VLGCTTDHDFLAPQPDPSGTAGGGAGAHGLFDDASVGDAAIAPDVSVPPPSDPEPDGPRSLTVVHGIVDATGPVVVCLSRPGDSGDDFLTGPPEPAGGLAYGSALTWSEARGIDFEADTLQIHVIAGEIGRVAGLPCADAIAEAVRVEQLALAPMPEGGARISDGGPDARPSPPDAGDGAAGDGAVAQVPPPALRQRSLAVIPAGSLSRARSYLAVLSGCIGGPAFTDESEHSICGKFYSTAQPTIVPTLVELSRDVARDRVGLQFLNASAALGTGKLVSLFLNEDTYEIASGVVYGEIEPRPPRQRIAVQLLEANIDGAALKLYAGNGSTPSLAADWSEVRATAGISELENARVYTAVLVGPHPSLTRGAWWNGPLLTVVDNDPLSVP
jgi:hypothetical protein